MSSAAGGGNRVPILMLTAREGTSARVLGLDAGADDYLVKPFALEELLARLRALLRRAQPEAGLSSRLTFADLLRIGPRHGRHPSSDGSRPHRSGVNQTLSSPGRWSNAPSRG